MTHVTCRIEKYWSRSLKFDIRSLSELVTKFKKTHTISSLVNEVNKHFIPYKSKHCIYVYGSWKR